MTKFVAHRVPFYHGTLNTFNRFRPLSHFGSHEVATFFTAPGRAHEEILESHQHMIGKATSQLKNFFKIASNDQYRPKAGPKLTPKIIPVHLNLTNTYELQDSENCHDYNSYKNTLLYYFMVEQKYDRVPPIFDFIFDDPLHTDSRSVRAQLQMDKLYAPARQNLANFTTREIDRYHLCFQRMIQFLENQGYDGFHYTNCHEDIGHVSYVAFRPESIKRLDVHQRKQKQPPRGPKIKKLAQIRDAYLAKHQSRDITDSEHFSLNLTKVYYKEIETKKLQTAGRKEIVHRPQFIRQAIRSKKYYAQMFIQDMLPQVQQISRQPRYGYHGLTHTEQVVLYGIDCAIATNQDPLPVVIAAAMHDCARQNDWYCERHGPDCEPIARDFINRCFPNLNPNIVERIIYAVVNHTTGTSAPDLVSACLWDADRIRLSWEEVYRPEFFNTGCGHKIASMNKRDQELYIKRQDNFLIRHKIKTRDQIEYERAMGGLNFSDLLDIEFGDLQR